MSEWISVKDKPIPTQEYGHRFLVYGITTCGNCYNEPSVFEAIIGNHHKVCYGEYECSVEATHWMPLPLPPKRKTNE